MKTVSKVLEEMADIKHQKEQRIHEERYRYCAVSAETVKLWCNGIIQEEIDTAVKNLTTEIDICLIESETYFRPFGTRYQCWRMIPSYRWDWGTYNSKAGGYFNIPMREGYVSDPKKIVEFISSFGYEVKMIDISIPVADTKTGASCSEVAGRKITISWG